MIDPVVLGEIQELSQCITNFQNRRQELIKKIDKDKMTPSDWCALAKTVGITVIALYCNYHGIDLLQGRLWYDGCR